eukprot:7235518-Prymnesium_polylepis.3
MACGATSRVVTHKLNHREVDNAAQRQLVGGDEDVTRLAVLVDDMARLECVDQENGGDQTFPAESDHLKADVCGRTAVDHDIAKRRLGHRDEFGPRRGDDGLQADEQGIDAEHEHQRDLEDAVDAPRLEGECAEERRERKLNECRSREARELARLARQQKDRAEPKYAPDAHDDLTTAGGRVRGLQPKPTPGGESLRRTCSVHCER